MTWHSLTMRTEFAHLEVESFVREITAAHAREVSTGLSREYRLYRREQRAGEHLVLIPPDAIHLAERTPTWGKQIKQLSVSPNLTGCSEIKLR
jgi:hypothetical protein